MSLKLPKCPKCKTDLVAEVDVVDDFIPVTCPKCEYSAMFVGTENRKLHERKKVRPRDARS